MTTLSPLVMGSRVVISTEHDLSAAAGARIFALGGNAIDAAIAAAFVEGIVNPHMYTIGGEAPMLIYSAKSRRIVSVNGNTAAPAAATIQRYRDMKIDLIPGEGLLAAGVPAAFDALVTALANFGTLSLERILEPALDLCETGFPVPHDLCGDPGIQSPRTAGGAALSLATCAQKFLERWPSSARLYLPGGKIPAPGTVLKNPGLARCFRATLEAEARSRNQGREAALSAARDCFYTGGIAREIVAWSEQNGGLLALSDLAGFRTKIEPPVSATYRGITVFKCQAWSQGPVFLQQLKLLEGYDLVRMGHNSADYIHTVVECAKLAFADREAWYGDPEMVSVPMEQLLSAEYASMRRELIDRNKASMALRPGDPRAMKPVLKEEIPAKSWGGGTIHVAAADREGNIIAITASGAWIPTSPVIESLGFPLGTRMQSFHLDERHPNALVPGKRPRTTLSPSLAMRGDEPYLAFGTPGGDQQDQWTLQFFLNVAEFEMNLQEAIEAPKFSTAHFPLTFYPHSADPGLLKIEQRIDSSVRDALAERGHRIEMRPPYSEGFVLAVEVDRASGVLKGGADPRGHQLDVMPAYVIGW